MYKFELIGPWSDKLPRLSATSPFRRRRAQIIVCYPWQEFYFSKGICRYERGGWSDW